MCFFCSAANSHDGLFSLSERHFISTAKGSWDSLFLCFVQVTFPNKQSVYRKLASYYTWRRKHLAFAFEERESAVHRQKSKPDFLTNSFYWPHDMSVFGRQFFNEENRVKPQASRRTGENDTG
jgi:hypothetical protein